MSGPEFADLRPISAGGTYAPFYLQRAFSPGGLNEGQIFPILPSPGRLDSFREGETLLVYLEIGFPKVQIVDNPDGTYVSGLRVKPFFLHANCEFRTPGDPPQTAGNPVGILGGLTKAVGGVPAPSQIDRDTLGGWSVFSQPFDPTLPQFDVINDNVVGNRALWIPSPKRLDTMPAVWGAAPLNVALPGTSDSILLDDVIFCPLPNPSSLPWGDPLSPWNLGPVTGGIPVNYRKTKVFSYPCFGRCLGISLEVVLAYLATDLPVPYTGIPVPPGPFGGVYPSIKLGYRAGVTHAVIQERLG
jgi:hypothetical protein